MVISTHLPPPVITERIADLSRYHAHVVLQLRHILLDSRLFRERPGQHELGLEHRPASIDEPIKGRPHPAVHRMPNPALDVFDGLARISLEPFAIEVLGHAAELDDEVAREVLRLDLSPLFVPKVDERRFIAAHDDPSIRTADEGAAVKTARLSRNFNSLSHQTPPRRICYTS